MNLTILATICIVTMFYIHIVFHLKTSDDLEVFEIPTLSRDHLEDVCNYRQPIVFQHQDDQLNLCTPTHLKHYAAFDVCVYDAKYEGIPLTLEEALPLFPAKSYATYNNQTFLNDTMAKKFFVSMDTLLRPPMVSTITYDVLFGHTGYTTRMAYSTYYRNYYYVSSGSITMKLTPPRNTRYLQEVKKYDTQEFYTNFNPWTDTLKKVKCIEIVVPQGSMVFIPAYWWYSIRLEKEACVCSIQYKTFMNLVATLPSLCMGVLQRQNTKVKVLPTYSLAKDEPDTESRTSEDRPPPPSHLPPSSCCPAASEEKTLHTPPAQDTCTENP